MALALLLPAALMAAAAAAHVALGGQIEPSPAAGHALMTAANFFLVFGGPMGEELGWRGYALPKLQDRLGWRTASLGLWVVWGGSAVAAGVLHTAINFCPSVVPVLPTETSYRPYTLVVTILVLTAMWLLAPHRAAGAKARRT